MTNARILDGQICYPTKYAEDVINIFHSRYKIFKNYHFNVVNIGIELMIFDVLNLIKDKYRFEDACGRISKDAEPFLELTDDILERVEDTYERMRAKGRRSDAEEIQKFKQAT
jgi:HD superfamily phosphohydrolase